MYYAYIRAVLKITLDIMGKLLKVTLDITRKYEKYTRYSRTYDKEQK